MGIEIQSAICRLASSQRQNMALRVNQSNRRFLNTAYLIAGSKTPCRIIRAGAKFSFVNRLRASHSILVPKFCHCGIICCLFTLFQRPLLFGGVNKYKAVDTGSDTGLIVNYNVVCNQDHPNHDQGGDDDPHFDKSESMVHLVTTLQSAREKSLSLDGLVLRTFTLWQALGSYQSGVLAGWLRLFTA